MQKKTRTADFVLVGMFAALMAIGANITSIVPFYRSAEFHLRCSRFLCACWSLTRQTAWRISYDCLCLGRNCWCTCIRPVLCGLWGHFRQKRRLCIIVHPCCLACWIHSRERKTLALAAFACSHCWYDRDVCDRNHLYIPRIKCMAQCTDFLSNHVVLYDLVYGKRLRIDDITCDAGT